MENTPTTKKPFSLDWLVRGTLTKLGEMFDQFTGRNWKPSSSLATSELIERLKKLLDSEARDLGEQGKFVPHRIKLLIQWDKFSTDAETSLKKLEDELLIAAVDHINDRRYHTFAPLKLEIKTDYFTEGVKLLASFDGFAEHKEKEGEREEAALNITLPDLKNVVLAPPEEVKIEPERESFTASFTINNTPKQVKLVLAEKQRLSVGRSRENDLWLDDAGVSKIHAALVLSSEKQLMVADTGSTNGTFVNGNRIAYGKAVAINDGERIKFGTVEVAFERVPKQTENNFAAEDFSTNEDIKSESFSAKEDVSVDNKFKTNKDFKTNEDFAGEPFEQKMNINLSENKTD